MLLKESFHYKGDTAAGMGMPVIRIFEELGNEDDESIMKSTFNNDNIGESPENSTEDPLRKQVKMIYG